MVWSWDEYLVLAEELVGSSQSLSGAEAVSRCAISRAYYAAFGRARNHLRDVDSVSVPSSGKCHTFVIGEFQSGSELARKRIGANLDRLRNARNRVDYRDSVPQVKNQVRAALQWSDLVMADLQAL